MHSLVCTQLQTRYNDMISALQVFGLSNIMNIKEMLANGAYGTIFRKYTIASDQRCNCASACTILSCCHFVVKYN